MSTAGPTATERPTRTAVRRGEERRGEERALDAAGAVYERGREGGREGGMEEGGIEGFSVIGRGRQGLESTLGGSGRGEQRKRLPSFLPSKVDLQVD